MFKKFLAALTTLALSLGMVALTAGPASAHAGNITASAVCNPATGKYDVTYKLSWSNIPNGVTAPIHTRTGTTSFDHGWSYPGGKTWTDRGVTSGASGSIQWTESLPGTTSGNGPWVYAYTPWSNNHDGATKHDTQVVGLAGNCGLPDDTSKLVPLCHYDSGQGGKWTSNTVSVSSVLNGTGHGGHSSDIIPPFTYVKQGVAGSYAGKNWTTYGQNVYNAGCNDVVPAEPSFTDAVCTGPGTWGQGSYTIPTTVGVRYLVKIGGGAWTEKSAGTYPVAVGTDIEIKAEALVNYNLYGTDSQWVWDDTIGKPSNCDQNVTPTTPTSNQPVCVAEGQVGQGSYTIPAIAGVKYEKSSNGTSGWTEVAAGTHYVADGTTVWIRAVELAGYELTGDDSNYKWKFVFDGPSSDKCDVPATPTFTAQVCTGPGSTNTASYTIPNDNGIKYQVRINGGSWQNVSAGTVNVTVFPRLVEVQALADGNIIVPGSMTSWSSNFTSAGDCIVNVTPVKPDWTDSVCEVRTTGSTQATYEVFATANVTYEVSTNGVDYAPISTGVHNATVGTTVWIKAVPASGYQLSGDTGPWSHEFVSPGDCLDKAVPGDPKFVDSICKANDIGAIQATYEIVAAANVTYEVSTNGVDYTSVGAAVGIHNVTPPTHIWIKAIADPGYEIDGQYIWDHNFVSPGDCLDDAPVEPVVASDQECKIDNIDTQAAHLESGTITIPNTAHVTYSVNGVAKGAGVHNYAPGTYTISAVADSGYKLTGVVPNPWTVTIKEAKLCGDLETHGDVTPIVSFVQTTCSASGSYTLAVITDDNPAGVIWTVSGGLPNSLGTHSVTTAGTVTITATAAPGYGLSGSQSGFIQWSKEFTSLPDDCLPTLALTGGSIAAGGLGFGALLTLGGILVFNARKRDLVANAE